VQRIHVIEGQHGFLAARGVSKGTHRWLDIVKHESAAACADTLRADGYRLWVAAMDGALRPEEVAREPGKLALVFGNEHRGASGPIRERADGTFAVPMRGFVESLNVSVAAAITMEAVTRGRPGDLVREERDRLVARYLLLSVRDGERVVREAAGSPR
jgi:tRNA (guanosine-2'-O-)-methyltransferase